MTDRNRNVQTVEHDRYWCPVFIVLPAKEIGEKKTIVSENVLRCADNLSGNNKCSSVIMMGFFFECVRRSSLTFHSAYTYIGNRISVTK